MYNKIIIVGNLTRDIEVRYSQGGAAIGNTGIASTRKFKTQTGEQKEEVLFVDITFFGRSAEIANQYLHKGSKLLVDGRLKFEQWEAKDGSRRVRHSISVENMTMLDSKGSNPPTTQEGEREKYPHNASTTNAPVSTALPGIDINEEEIPF